MQNKAHLQILQHLAHRFQMAKCHTVEKASHTGVVISDRLIVRQFFFINRIIVQK